MHAVILSGGAAHDFPATSACLAELCQRCGLTPHIAADPTLWPTEIGRADLLIINTLRWTMRRPSRYAAHAATQGYVVPEDVREPIRNHLRRGSGLIAMHAASLCFDDWSEWAEIIGARWDWDTSHHPPVGDLDVSVSDPTDPLVAGLPDFTVQDEAYGFLNLANDVHGLLTACHSGAEHPLLWHRQHGAGRVVHNALGHGESSLRHPVHREIIMRAIQWTVCDVMNQA